MTDESAGPRSEVLMLERDFGDENYGDKILSGGIVRVVGFTVSTLLAVISISILTREIGPADFALFTTATSLMTAGFSFSDFGLAALGVRDYALLDGAERERSLRALMMLRVILSTIAGAGMVAFAIVSGLPEGVVLGLAAAGLGLVFFSLYVSYNIPVQATMQLNLLAVLDTVRQFVHSALVVAAAVLAAGVGTIIGMFLPASLIMMLISMNIARHYISVVPSIDVEKMRVLAKDLGAFAIAASVGTTYVYVAQVASNHVLSEYDSGQFALAFRVFAVAIGACFNAVTGAFPLLVTAFKEDRQRINFAARRLFQTVVLAGLVATVGMVTGASIIVNVIGGPEFSDAVPLIRVVSIGIPFTFILITATQVLLASDRHRAFILISIVGALVSVAATWALAATQGPVGAAIGLVAGEAIIALGYVVVILHWDRRMLPRVRWLFGALICAVAGCAVALTPLTALASVLVGLLVMGALTLLLRLVPPEILALVPRRR